MSECSLYRLINTIQHFFQCFKRKGLHFIHINARSLLYKIDELRIISSKTNAAVIGISETWLDDSIFDSELLLPNYTIQRHDRNRNGGGVCVYIRNDISFNRRTDLENTDLEVLFVELLLPKTKPIICGICYRPPKLSNFYDQFETLCSSSDRFIDQEVICLGDFNTNVQKSSCLVNSLNQFCRIIFNH